MANEIKLKKWNGSAWVQQYPEVRHTDIVASGTPSSSNFLRGDGAWANVGDGNTKFYAWRAINNTSASGVVYYRIANVSASQSSRFQIELTGRYAGYGDGDLPNYCKILGQLNNDNNYDVWWFNNETGTSQVVSEVGIVDDGNNGVNIWVKVSNFAEVTATAYLSDGTITTYDSNSETSSAPTGYTVTTEYKMWNSGNDGSGSGLSADTVDGIHGGSFLRSDTDDSASGDLTFNGVTNMTGNLKLTGNKAISIGANNSNDAVSGDPDAQLVLDGLHNNGYNNSTKLLIRGYDNESARSVIKTIDENGNTDLHITANSSNPIMYFRGRVGIGDTTPSYSLEVAGDMAVNKIFDRNNGSYYLDPASTSNVNTLLTRGSVVVDTDTNQNLFYISRTGSTSNEYTSMGRDDGTTHIHTKNDESSATVRFRFENTDTESGGGANANDRNIDLISDATDARILIAGNRVATENYVDTEIASLVASAPSTLDTLNELASALGDDANFSTTVTNSLAGKLSLSGGTMTSDIKFTNATDIGIENASGNSWYRPEDQYGNTHIEVRSGKGLYVDADIIALRSQANTDRLRITSAGDVGIGTTSPQKKLDVIGDIRISNSNPILQLNDTGTTTGDAYIDYQAGTSLKVHAGSDALTFVAGNAERARISSGGNFGIGTTSPASKLEVAGDIQLQRSNEIIFGETVGGNPRAVIFSTENEFSSDYNGLGFSIGNQGRTGPSMYIRSDGKVGIGTTTPAEKLTVSGKVRANDNFEHLGSGGYYLYTDAVGFRGALYDNGSYTSIYGDGNGSTPVININSDLVGIGTTNPGSKLQVSSSGTALGRFFSTGNGDNHGLYININETAGAVALDNNVHFASSGSNSGSFTFATGNDERMRIATTGNVGIGITNPASKLDVDGTIRATKFEVSNDSDGSNEAPNWQISEYNNQIVASHEYITDTYHEIFHEGNPAWKQIYSGTATITSGTSTTTITTSETLLNQGGQDQTIIAFELNSSSMSSYTSQVHIVKLENSNSSAAGVLFNAQAHNSSIQVGSIRVFRGLNATDLSFSYSFKFTNGSSSETADTVYVGRVWKLRGISGV